MAVEDDLGRLLDRAAGALSRSHPELAGELTAQADRVHAPADLVEELQSEVLCTLLAVHGDRYYERPAMGSMAVITVACSARGRPAPSHWSTVAA